jgi:ABC-2 type transport system permease protein
MTQLLRTLRWSTWLGWQVESNWADWRLFILYLVIKPVTGSLALVCMYFAAKYAIGSRVPSDALPFIYVSNACYGLIGTVMFGMSYVVITDREHYRMLKYIFISPALFPAYFLGRGLARALEGTVGGLITIIVGTLLFREVRASLAIAGVDWGWLAAFLLVGGLMLWACGMILASAVLNMQRNGMFLSDGIAGVVYLLSGVAFPLQILPTWMQYVGLSLPTTYWLEGMRRSITGVVVPDTPMSDLSNLKLLGILLITTVIMSVIAVVFYRWSVKKAWRNGKIEETTGA